MEATLLALSPVLLAAVALIAALSHRPVLAATYAAMAAAALLDMSTIGETVQLFVVLPCTLAPLLWIATDDRCDDSWMEIEPGDASLGTVS